MRGYGVKSDLTRAVLACSGALLLQLALFGAVWMLADGDNEAFLNQVMPLGLFLTLGWFALAIVRRHPVLIWSPIPWFLAACGAYYGLGPLAYHFGNEETVAICDGYYTITEAELLRTNFLNLIAITSAAVGAYLGVRVFLKHEASDEDQWSLANHGYLSRLALSFLGIGLVVKYGLVLPYEFGSLGFVLPGSVEILQYFTAFGMAVFMVLVHRGDVKWRPLLYALIASEFITAILVFSKMSVMIFFVMLLLGRVLSVRRLRPILVGAAFVGLSFTIVAPLVSHGRTTLTLLTGSHFKAGIGPRFEIVKDYILSGGESVERPPSQLGWARLNYANAQAFAMNAFDDGAAGDSFSTVLYTLVPRFLWPDKPIMTVGRDFNYLVNGNPESSSAPGVFGESYWNGGWLAVVLAALFVGLLLGGFTEYSMWAIQNSNLLFLPIVFTGIKMGFRPDDWFVATYVGTPITAVCLHYVLRGLSIFLRNSPFERGRQDSGLVTS